MMSEEKPKKTIYINHSMELLIWLFIVLIFAIAFFFSKINNRNAEYEYNIFMPDVDGMIVGSPVRAMGIEIGYVTEIKPIKDELYVKFLITDKSVILPQGTVATVEFSGMAGSKSLELYLPDKNTYIDSSVPIISVSSPKRLHDAAGLLNEMFKKIGNIITVSSQFSSKLSKIDFPGKISGGENPREFLKYTDTIIDKQQKRADDFGRKLNEYRKK